MSRVTVLMPVYNAAPFVQAAIDSILSQSFKAFELLIIDDASTDETADIVRKFKDPRINFITNDKNMGIAATLNRGLDRSNGEYIARMDADDISFPDRLKRQVDFLNKNPEVAVVGSWVNFIGIYSGAKVRMPWGPACVRAHLCLGNPLCHPAVMIRKTVLDEYKMRYDEQYSRSEDYDLWSRIGEYAGLDNIPEVLLAYRVHNKSVSLAFSHEMNAQELDLLNRELNKIGIEPSKAQLAFHAKIIRGHRQFSRNTILDAHAWFSKVYRKNQETKYHDPDGMARALSITWFRLCANSGNLGWWIWQCWKSAPFIKGCRSTISDKLRFLASIAWNAYIKKAFGAHHAFRAD